MTVYVSDRSWRDPHPHGPEWFNLWADTSTEAIACLYGIGGTIDQRRVELNMWEAYRITPGQFAAAVGLGATLTDAHGPAYWLAIRSGNRRTIQAIEAARARGN